ncbi:MAG: PEPxxWA-CTERM sorting domain-containing protein [Pseudomonadota bacterium]
MRKALLCAAAIAFAGVASSASADIVRVDASTIQGANVLFNDGTQINATVFGNTNLGTNTVAFTGTTVDGGTTLRASGGQAVVEGGTLNGATNAPNDVLNLSSLQFGLIDGATFNNLEFNVFGGDATSVSFQITDNGGQVFNFASALTGGSNFFGFVGIDGQTIANVSATLVGGGVGDFRQIRLDGFAATPAVPEPGTWAMMLIGFGGMGVAMRRRRRTGAQFAQAA